MGLLVSTNNGTTFAIASVGGISATQAMVSFAGAKQGGTTRTVCITMNNADVFPGLFIEGIYDSYIGVYSLDWGQANWTLRTSGIPSGDEPAMVAMALTTFRRHISQGSRTVEFPDSLQDDGWRELAADVAADEQPECGHRLGAERNAWIGRRRGSIGAGGVAERCEQGSLYRFGICACEHEWRHVLETGT